MAGQRSLTRADFAEVGSLTIVVPAKGARAGTQLAATATFEMVPDCMLLESSQKTVPAGPRGPGRSRRPCLVAARENHVVELGYRHVVDGVIDRRMHDLEFAGGETLPLRGRPFREFEVEPQCAP